MTHKLQPVTAVVCAVMLVLPAGAQTVSTDSVKTPGFAKPSGFWSRLTSPYTPKDLAPINLQNSNRLDSLLRAGRLYLSLQDAIALALENNLDIEVQRYGPLIADASLLRAQAGGFARGVSTTVQTGPTSATTAAGGQAQTGISQNAASQANAATSTAVGNTVITQTGSGIPSLDPALIGGLRWGHQTTPQTSAFITGTNSLINTTNLSNLQVQKGWLTGTSASLGLSNSGISSNNRSADFNPATTSSLTLTVTQRLLQGFGVAVNSRQIRIARNNREIADLTFKGQVIATVSAVMNLYWDLVSFNEDVRVKRQALALSEKLYNDNKKQVEIGTLAPIEVVRAEAEVANRQQDLTISETNLLQQETIIKNALSRNGVASPSLSEARIVPTDRMQLPAVEPVAPVQDLVGTALSARPELAQNRIQIQNQQISLKGSRSALLPSLDAVATVANNGLAGSISELPVVPGRTRANNPFFVGGYGTVLSQLFSRNFPDYSVGVNLNIPIRNRAAQADMINDELTLRQQELLYQRQVNQVRVDVQNAMIGLQQARARYQAATKARVLQEQTLDAEQKKYELGASTIYNVILAQRDLAAAQSAEVTALASYSRARVELDRATGTTLVNHSISLDEAYRGTVSRPPSALPPEAPAQP